MAGNGAGDGGPGGWYGRVEFSDGGTAYAPGEVLVPRDSAEDAEAAIMRRQRGRGTRRDDLGDSSFVRLLDVEDPTEVVTDLRRRGVAAQLNNVLFSHCSCCGCGAHPAALWPSPPGWAWANPFAANPFAANPFAANPFAANPFAANPFAANPFAANPFAANPFAANPFAANPFAANPFAANPYVGADINASPTRLLAPGGARPETAAFRTTGVRPHSAHAAGAPDLPDAPDLPANGERAPYVVVVDTGIAEGPYRPAAVSGVIPYDDQAGEVPDREPQDGLLDPVAGHGTFIAGIIDRIAPGARLEVHGLLTGLGEASEVDVAGTLESFIRPEGAPDLVNLSFGGYSVIEMGRLAEAVRRLQGAGTVVVASAGNDSTCWPSFPAALPGVVSVGALGTDGPAHFTNYGPWVRACAPGVDIVSSFFAGWKAPDGEKDLGEWVRWSGTSFAAPAVVGALARAMRGGVGSARDAVERVVDDPALFRIPGLGTVVNETPWCIRR